MLHGTSHYFIQSSRCNRLFFCVHSSAWKFLTFFFYFYLSSPTSLSTVIFAGFYTRLLYYITRDESRERVKVQRLKLRSCNVGLLVFPNVMLFRRRRKKKNKGCFLVITLMMGGGREGGMSYLVRSFLFLLYLFVFLLSGHDVD